MTFQFPYTREAIEARRRNYSEDLVLSENLIFSQCFDLLESYGLGNISDQDLVRWLGDWCDSVNTCIRRAGVLSACIDQFWEVPPTTPSLNTNATSGAPIVLSPTRNIIVTSGRKRKHDEYMLSQYDSAGY